MADGGHDWYWEPDYHSPGVGGWLWLCFECVRAYPKIETVNPDQKPGPDYNKEIRKCDRCHDDYHFALQLDIGSAP